VRNFEVLEKLANRTPFFFFEELDRPVILGHPDKTIP